MVEGFFTIAEIAEYLHEPFFGDGSCRIYSLAPIDKAQSGQATFLENTKFCKFLKTSQASLILLKKEYQDDCATNGIICNNPQLSFAKLAERFQQKPQPVAGIHSTAVIGKNCQIDESASIGAFCTIGEGVIIGPGVVLGSHCHVGDHCHLEAHCYLYPRVTLYSKVFIDAHSIIHSGVVIGSDGFGYAQSPTGWYKIPQMGGVHIGKNVEIGANTTIDRGALENTVIEDGVKLDNQIQIAHNVRVGAHTIMAAGVAIAGSTTIGKYCMIGGAAGIAGHLTIADNVIITAMTGISKSMLKPGVYSGGVNAAPREKWLKNVVRFQHLDEIAERLNRLEKKLEVEESL